MNIETLEDLTVEDYMFLNSINKLDKETSSDMIFREVVKYFKLEDIEYKDVIRMFDKLKAVLDSITSSEPILRFTYKGVEYGMDPNIDKILTGPFCDLTLYENDENNIHRFLAIMYRPIVKEGRKWFGLGKKNGTYALETYEGSDKYCEIMKKQPVQLYLNSVVFFCNSEKELLNDLTISMTKNQSQIIQTK